MKITNLLFLLAVTLFSADFAQADRVGDCQPDNAMPGQCACFTFDSDDYVTGEIFPQCDTLACDQFLPRHVPTSCQPGSFRVTCQLNWEGFPLGCFMNFPRATAGTEAQELCHMAVEDVNNNGNSSAYYKNLDYMTCRPTGWGYPPAYGWELVNVSVERPL